MSEQLLRCLDKSLKGATGKGYGVEFRFTAQSAAKSEMEPVTACARPTEIPLTEDPTKALLLVMGMQSRVMPHVAEADSIVSKSLLLLKAANLLHKPVLFAEQTAHDLGETVVPLARYAQAKLHMDEYDATRVLLTGHVSDEISHVVMIGAEAHGCIMQTGFGLLRAGKAVAIVTDAVGSRHAAEKSAALARLARRGAEIVTAEMTVLEWLGSRATPRSGDVLNLIEDFRDGGRRRKKRRQGGDVNRLEPKSAETSASITIGALLRNARLAKALTLAKLALQTECSLSQLSKIENDKAVPSLPLLYRLSDALGKDVESFLASSPATGLQATQWSNDEA